MGGSSSGGYMRKDVNTPYQNTELNRILGMANPNMQQAGAGYAQFLPGGGGGQPIINAANQNFQQQTLPSILNAYGSGNKGSSALNQALASGASNMNTDLAALLSQLQLQAAQGASGLGLGQGQLGSQPQFAYMPKQQSFLQSLLLGLTGAGGQLGGAALSRPVTNFSAAGMM